MKLINYYRFGSYALLAMGLINLRYQSGSAGNLSTSSVLIAIGSGVLVLTFIPKVSNLLLTNSIKKFSLVLLIALIIYGILI
jgi:hypothetical protein